MEEPRLNADGHYAIWKAASDAAKKLDPRPRTEKEYEFWRNQDPCLPPRPDLLYAIAWGTTGGWDGFLGVGKRMRTTVKSAPTQQIAETPKPVVAEKPPEPPPPAPTPPHPEPIVVEKVEPKLVRRSNFQYVSFRDSGYDDD